MNRGLTNFIRLFLDECIPPIVRDNKYFMLPLFYIWYKGKNVKQHMEFKSAVNNMTKEEFSEFYRQRESLARDRSTDLSDQCINHMIARIVPEAKTLLDVGCGNGYFLQKVQEKGYTVTGCDMMDHLEIKGGNYVEGNIENLPFKDGEFDVVTAHHTLEHVINLEKSISELKRVARKQVIVVVPCQRYFYYTLDEHVRFFPYEALLVHPMGMKNYTCEKVWGDWVYIGLK